MGSGPRGLWGLEFGLPRSRWSLAMTGGVIKKGPGVSRAEGIVGSSFLAADLKLLGWAFLLLNVMNVLLPVRFTPPQNCYAILTNPKRASGPFEPDPARGG